MEHYGLPRHRPPQAASLEGATVCDWCGAADRPGLILQTYPGDPFVCDPCFGKGAHREPPPPSVSREAVDLPNDPAIPIKPLRQGGQPLKADPLAGLGDIGKKK